MFLQRNLLLKIDLAEAEPEDRSRWPERARKWAGPGTREAPTGETCCPSMPDTNVGATLLPLHFPCPQHCSPYHPLSKTLFTIAMLFPYFYWGQKMKRFSQAYTRHQQRTDASEAGSFARAEIQRNSSGTVVGLRRMLSPRWWRSPRSTPIQVGWPRSPPSPCAGTLLLSSAARGGFVAGALCGLWLGLVSRREMGSGGGGRFKEGLQAIIRALGGCLSLKWIGKYLGEARKH